MSGFLLTVDPVACRDEIVRFWAKVVRGPGSACWIWSGAVGDDGYGSFSIRRPALDDGGQLGVPGAARVPLREHVVSAPRYALAATYGVMLAASDVAAHEVCDEPICVRVHQGVVDGGLAHVVVSTQADNLAQMGRRGRGGGTPRPWQARGLNRRERAARSRALRDVVKEHGWDVDRMDAAVAALQPAVQARLF
ncbi:hypothetical protein ACIOBK_33905 [Micromonospora chokoriensis]